jgi:ferredoxin
MKRRSSPVTRKEIPEISNRKEFYKEGSKTFEGNVVALSVVIMTKWIIQHDREGCIGCGACTSFASEHFEMAGDGKAQLIDGKLSGKMFEKEVEDGEEETAKTAAGSCPANVIHVIEKK